MAESDARLQVVLEAKIDKLTERLSAANRAVYGASGRIQRDVDAINRKFQTLGSGLTTASRAAQIALAGVSAFAIKLAADAAEIESAFDVAFKGSAKSAREFSNALGDRLGRDAVETRQAMTRLQLVLTGTGVAAEQSAEMVKRLAEAGIDAGSLFNTSDAEAFQKIISGLTGESEPLKAFGVVINEAAVKTELLRLGFQGTASEASEAAKSIARANLIIKGLAVAQGDAERTSGSAANQMKRTRAEFNKAARELGDQLIPTFIKLAGVTTDALKAFNELPGGVQIAGLSMLALVAAGGPIAGLITNLQRLIKVAGETRKALAPVTGANVAAGASGFASGAGALGGAALSGAGVLAIPVAAGAVLADPNPRQFRKTVKEVDKATDEALAASVNFARGNLARIAKSNPGAGAKELVAKLQTDLATLTAEQQKRAAKQGAATAAAAPTAVAGGFTLPDALKTATGGAGKGGSGRAAARDLNDEQLAQIAAQVQAAELDVLSARRDLATSAEERAQIERDIIGRRQAQENARLDAQIAAARDAKGISEATRASLVKDLESLKLKTAEVADLERHAIDREAAEEKARLGLELEQTRLDGQEQLLQLQASSARTAKARLEAELALLDLAEQRAEAELAVIEATRGTASAEAQIAAQRLENVRNARPGQEAEAAQRNQGPLESYFSSLPQTAAEANERFEALAANGIADVVDGLAQALAGTRSLGDVFRTVLAQMAVDLTRLNLQRALIGLVGSFSGGSAGVAPSVNGIFGYASGGVVRGPGTSTSDDVFARLSAGEFVVNAASAKRNMALLRAINAGVTPRPASANSVRQGDTFHLGGITVAGPMSPADARRTGAQIGSAAMRQMALSKRRGY